MKLKLIVTCEIEQEVETVDRETIQNLRETVNDNPVGMYWANEEIEIKE